MKKPQQHRLRYSCLDYHDESSDDGVTNDNPIANRRRQRQQQLRYHGTSILSDAIHILWKTTTIAFEDNTEEPIAANQEREGVYVTACILFHRYYNQTHGRPSKQRTLYDNDANEDEDDVWSVSMACVLLACKLQDIPLDQVSIFDIIESFLTIYRQRILLPHFIPATTTTANTTVDVMAKQKEYYTATIAPLVPSNWKLLSIHEQQQRYDEVEGTTKTVLLSRQGPIYTAWHQALVQMECKILHTLQYRIYDIPDMNVPSMLFSQIPTLCQRYIETIPKPTLSLPSLSTLTSKVYEYCRIAVQIITEYNDPNDNDQNSIKHDGTNLNTTTPTTVPVSIAQVIAVACLYCAVTEWSVSVHHETSDTNDNHNHSLNGSAYLDKNTNHPHNNPTSLTGVSDGWKRILLLLLSKHDPNDPANDETSLLAPETIQNEIDTLVYMLQRTLQDPDYYVAQSNYCHFATTTTNSLHGPDSYTWHRCITNIL
jgi:hypothetical protein